MTLISSLVFKQSSQPKIEYFDSNSVLLSTSIDSEAQKNYCKVNRAEFKCEAITDPYKSITVYNSLSAEISNLEPFTDYKCYVRVENSNEKYGGEKAYSPYSGESSFKTKEGSE